MTTLTDRYVDATLRRLPGRQRADIEKELRTAIADAVDDRVEAGGDPAAAEIEVLTGLGDPSRLAAGYADRPLHLIGPALYHDYTRLLAVLLATVVPAVAAGVGLVRALRGEEALTLAGDALSAAFTAAVHIACWTTLAFAALDRLPRLRPGAARPWSVDTLPARPSRRARYAELATLTVVTALFCTFVLLTPVVSTRADAAGEPIGLLAPWLWETGVVYAYLAAGLAGLGFAFARHYARWSVPLALSGALVEVAAPLTLIWLVTTDRVLNPAFVAAAGWGPDTTRWIGIGLIAMSSLSLLHTVTDGLAQARHR
ncbi:permease prefix domain 1-containing protein [Catellatospora citrea]|uniref:permease prefix domain 1-containing protein n=1 Tax=Catellatospora citrea TaxID=53366 RepID=UPI00340BB138